MIWKSSMADTDSIYVYHILQAVERIESYTAGLSYERFREDVLKQDGIVRQLEIIGEAAKNVPEDIVRKNKEIPWKKMAGMRDRLIHFYFGVKHDLVWRTIKQDIPQLKPLIQKIIDEPED